MSGARSRVAEAFERAAAYDDPAVFLALADRDRALARLADGEDGPLAGVTFAVKDNIHVAGLPTTVGFPPASAVAATSAPCVSRLEAAGATCIAKTNLDQFATGLTGMRSPYGTPRNPLDARLAPGGSSSGSAVAVAAGLVDLALGTDTAGSGRVPAAQCRIVGCKPTRGLVSTRGVVPAVRSLDCVSVLAGSVREAAGAVAVIEGFDPADPWSRPVPAGAPGRVRRLGVPAGVDLDGPLDRAAWEATIAALTDGAAGLGIELVEVDLAPLVEAGDLLYNGPFVAARVAAIGHLADLDRTSLDPSVATILDRARRLSAADAYRGEDQLAAARRGAELAWAGVDGVLAPTTPGPATSAEVVADPLGRNARLGRYTNGANLLDLCAVSVPGADRSDGWPTGVSLLAPAWSDLALVDLATQLVGEAVPDPPPPSGATLDLAVVGAHLRGLPLHHQLTDLGATFVAETTTAPAYRLYALAGTVPPKPGLVWVGAGGAAVAAEVWRLPIDGVGRFLAAVPAPLALGTVELAGGTSCHGFVCEPRALDGALDITEHGGWRAYLRAR